ncbi:MAG: hypothetical protein L0Z50_39595 [Verrucomicrobiales bacterium]|nr:hypothetical protein [Verrucomicrobiales bacterium]
MHDEERVTQPLRQCGRYVAGASGVVSEVSAKDDSHGFMFLLKLSGLAR